MGGGEQASPKVRGSICGYKAVVMGSSEDKVKLFDDDDLKTPPTTVVDENEEGSGFCQLTCVSVAFLVVFGVFFSLVIFPSSPQGDDQGYKARIHQLNPEEDLSDSGLLHDSRMEEERLRMKMFPEFRPWSKPEYPKHNTHSNPRGKTPTNTAGQTHTNPTDRTHPTKTNDPPPRPDKANDPPPRPDKAKTARYIVHKSDWGSISTISASMDGAPFGMVASFSDGTVTNSTGVPYFYLTKDDPVVKNMELNAMSSLALSEAQSEYCKEHDWDPEEPLCSRVTVIGTLVHVGPGEEKFAQNALFSRHPVMKTWPKDHGWQTLKLEITHVWLLDFYGPATMVPVKDYFNVKL